MNEPQIYVPKCNAKEHVFRNGGSIIKLGLHVETMITFLKEHANEKGYVNLALGKRKEPGKYGETHTVTLDTWQPNQQAGPGRSAAEGEQTDAQRLLAERRATGAPASKGEPEDDGFRVPF